MRRKVGRVRSWHGDAQVSPTEPGYRGPPVAPAAEHPGPARGTASNPG